jgi:hypothetical protein
MRGHLQLTLRGLQGALKEWRSRMRRRLQVAVDPVKEFYGAMLRDSFLAAAKPSMALRAGQELAVREVCVCVCVMQAPGT